MYFYTSNKPNSLPFLHFYNMEKPTIAYDIAFSANNTNTGEGWCCGTPAGISTTQWPRGRSNGEPMAHIWTLLVPEQYRTKGSDYVAISLFHADDHVSDTIEDVTALFDSGTFKEPTTAIPFWKALLDYAQNKHPQEQYFEDLIGGGWALIWLTEAEFRSASTTVPDPAIGIYPGYETFDGTNAYKQNSPAKYITLVERINDPNVGKNITEFPDEEEENAYVPLFTTKAAALNLDDRFFGKSHFGGTSSPSQGEPDFSPFYFEFDEVYGNANLGGDGVAQIDLLHDKFDWACG